MTRKIVLTGLRPTQYTPKWCQIVTQDGSFHGTEDGVCGSPVQWGMFGRTVGQTVGRTVGWSDGRSDLLTFQPFNLATVQPFKLLSNLPTVQASNFSTFQLFNLQLLGGLLFNLPSFQLQAAKS